jgi:hypothetical protein
MELLQAAWEGAKTVADSIRQQPPQLLAIVWLVGVLSAFVLLLLVASVRFFVARLRSSEPEVLRVTISQDEGLVRVNSNTINRLGLTRASGQRVIVSSVRKSGKGYRRLETLVQDLSWRAPTNLANDTIEISDRALAKLFKGEVVKDGEQRLFNLELYKLEGIADYWMNPDPRIRFGNRFAVTLALAVLAIEAAINFLPQFWK